MTKPINIESIEKATSKSWNKWVEALEGIGAKDMAHVDIARRVETMLEGSVESPGWWAQSITVAYEQHIGRRVPGQMTDGSFATSVSKAVATTRAELFPKVVTWFESQASLNGCDFTKPRSAETPKRSNWRCNLADGSKFMAMVEDNGQKTKLVLSHTALSTKQEADNWRAFWKDVIGQLAEE